MGYKILDVKEDIKEALVDYFSEPHRVDAYLRNTARISVDDLCDIVDKHFEKIER